jgi:hypothetical protein
MKAEDKELQSRYKVTRFTWYMEGDMDRISLACAIRSREPGVIVLKEKGGRGRGIVQRERDNEGNRSRLASRTDASNHILPPFGDMRAGELALELLARIVHDGAWDAFGGAISSGGEARSGTMMRSVLLHWRAQDLVAAGDGQATHAREVRYISISRKVLYLHTCPDGGSG